MCVRVDFRMRVALIRTLRRDRVLASAPSTRRSRSASSCSFASGMMAGGGSSNRGALTIPPCASQLMPGDEEMIAR